MEKLLHKSIFLKCDHTADVIKALLSFKKCIFNQSLKKGWYIQRCTHVVTYQDQKGQLTLINIEIISYGCNIMKKIDENQIGFMSFEFYASK